MCVCVVVVVVGGDGGGCGLGLVPLGSTTIHGLTLLCEARTKM